MNKESQLPSKPPFILRDSSKVIFLHQWKDRKSKIISYGEIEERWIGIPKIKIGYPQTQILYKDLLWILKEILEIKRRKGE